MESPDLFFSAARLVKLFVLTLLWTQMICLTTLGQNRSLVNTGFEAPQTPTLPAATWTLVDAANSNSPQIEGWNTTATDRKIEIWSDGFLGFNAYAGLGDQWAELNATQSSRLYQNICLVEGETLTWEYFHRGRGSSTIPDVMELNIYDASGTSRLATLQTASTTNTGWISYTGSYVVTLPTGSYQFSFEAISTGSGNHAIGNFLDGVTIQLAPLIEFELSSYRGQESLGDNLPRYFVNGTLASPATLDFVVSGGSATEGKDFRTTLSVLIPAGSYTPADFFTLPLDILDDYLTEADEDITITLVSLNGADILADGDCDGTHRFMTGYTIIDDDEPLPLRLLSLQAYRQEGKVILHWITSDEHQVLEYVVEESLDGVLFTPKGSVPANNANGLQQYSLELPDVQESGSLYYRLLIKEQGSAFFSSITHIGAAEQKILFFPNPSEGLVYVRLAKEEPEGSVEISDGTGRIVYSNHLTSDSGGLHGLNLEFLQEGLYYVKILSSKRSVSLRLVKK